MLIVKLKKASFSFQIMWKEYSSVRDCLGVPFPVVVAYTPSSKILSILPCGLGQNVKGNEKWSSRAIEILGACLTTPAI